MSNNNAPDIVETLRNEGDHFRAAMIQNSEGYKMAVELDNARKVDAILEKNLSNEDLAECEARAVEFYATRDEKKAAIENALIAKFGDDESFSVAEVMGNLRVRDDSTCEQILVNWEMTVAEIVSAMDEKIN